MTPSELKALRHKAGLTCEQVGRYVGVSRALIGFYETGRVPIPEARAAKIMEVFCVKPLDTAGEPKSPHETKRTNPETKHVENDPQKSTDRGI